MSAGAASLPHAKLLAGNPARSIAALPDADIVNAITVAISAGTDTTGTALAYIFFELARHQHWFARLRAELAHIPLAAAGEDVAMATTTAAAASASDEAAQARYSVPALRDVQHLPVLNAIFSETLRLHPPVPAKLSRVAPRGRLASVTDSGGGGRGSSGSGVSVAGVWVPAGTLVSVPPFTLQRTADVFPAPDAWNRARWFVYGASRLL
jgi:cytochrome P450